MNAITNSKKSASVKKAVLEDRGVLITFTSKN